MRRNGKNIEMKRIEGQILFALLSILLVLGSMAYLYEENRPRPGKYIAKEGQLDLTSWQKEKRICLDGQWEFYPGLLIDPGEESFDDYKDQKTLIQVPGDWKDGIKSANPPEGYGTYRLRIQLPEEGIYGIKTQTIRLSSQIYANGQEILKIGQVAKSRPEFTPESKYKIAALNSQEGEMELVVQVASYGYRTGGIIKSIEFDSYDKILKGNQRERALESQIIATCLVLGLYFVLLYFRRRESPYLLYFGLTCIFIGLYLSTMNEQILDLIIDYSFVTRSRIQGFALIASTICILQFVHCYFGQYEDPRTKKILSGILLAEMSFVFVNYEKPMIFNTMQIQVFVSLTVIVSYALIIMTLIRALKNKVESSKYILLLMISILLYWLSIIGKAFFELSNGKLPLLLIGLMSATASLLINDRLNSDYKEAKELTDQLLIYDRQKDEFLARVSHELRTPLHVILSLSRSLAEGKKGSLSSGQQESLLFINQEGKRLARLVEDLLDASRYREETSIQIGPVDIYDIVQNLCKEMEILIPQKDQVQLINLIGPEAPLLKGDRDKVTQILYNLIDNAIKYSKKGEIKVRLQLEGDMARISVTDQGIGIQEKDIEKIFDIFYQNNEDKNVAAGLGIGLAISKQLAEGLGGALKVQSNYGQGSSFSFSLPICKEQGAKLERRREPEIKVLSDKKEVKIDLGLGPFIQGQVLVIDDESSNQRVISDLLSEMNLRPIMASNGVEGLKAIEENKIDLLILDFMLPGQSGDSICREIRKKYDRTELPILVLTASGRNVDMINSFENGANDFARKPIEAEELKSRIQSLLLMKKSVEEGLEKEFQYFYSQISPHFLYNTLNTIIGLCSVDQEKAKDALYYLSTYFRGKLDIHRGKKLISLNEELELVRAYLEIEKMRYGDRLDIHYDIEEGLSAQIPPLTIQPLAENAIQHGIIMGKKGGKLTISARREAGMIQITVEDDGAGMSLEKQDEILNGSSRIGFRNSMEKLKILKNASFDLKSQLGQGTIISIRLPEENYESSSDR